MCQADVHRGTVNPALGHQKEGIELLQEGGERFPLVDNGGLGAEEYAFRPQ